MAGEANQDRFLGALLGLAIGDAVGMPLVGLSAETVAERFGREVAYRPHRFPDGTEIGAGEVTDETEIALCVIESYTVEGGRIDPDNIGARLAFLARGESRRWMHPATLAAIERASESDVWQQPLVDDAGADGEVAVRGVPVGLMHAVGASPPGALEADAETVARLTHGSAYAINAVAAVAEAVQLAARRAASLAELPAAVRGRLGNSAVAEAIERVAADSAVAADAARVSDLAADDAAEVIATALAAVAGASDFPSCLLRAAHQGGAADSRAAIAGALYGAYHGSAGIPQRWIDELEPRIYISLAAPPFWRTVAKQRDRLIELRPRG